VPSVEHQPIAETLPVLYRAVLDAVAELEARGLRREAATIRADATEAYSGPWNPGATRRLSTLRDRARKVLHGRRGQRRPAVVIEPLERRVRPERTTV
jgi:hypothetical protein